jgi:hypothetical protein
MCLLLFGLSPLRVEAVPITGANGNVVDFAGVKAATPAGLVVKIQASGNEVTVPWDKFDLAKMQAEQAEIFAAYQKSQAGETTNLSMGVFKKEMPAAPTSNTTLATRAGSDDHYVQTVVSGQAGSGFSKMTVAMRRPSPNAKAIFVGVFGEGRGYEHFSSIYLARGERSSWDDFWAQNKLVPVGIRIEWSMPDPRKEPWFLADKGSGDALLQAIATLAKQAGRDDLANAPLVIYGRETMGSSFTYNLTQYKPDRVLCAVAMKSGAFYNIEPTESSVKVPMLLVKGEYDDSHREWQLEPTLSEDGREIDPPHEAFNRFKSTQSMRPNWSMVIEPRGTTDINPMTELLGKEFVTAVVKQRFGSGQLTDMVPDIYQMGNLTEKTIKNMPGDQGVLSDEETWLPDPQFAKAWQKFLNGELIPPPPPRPE